MVRLTAVSKNAGISGILLEASESVPVRTAVNFVMTLSGGSLSHSVELSGEGKVVRLEPGETEAGYAIAIECTRPITQIEEHYYAGG